ncbi:MAG TPA: T9SS type A sorting domain-containing protein [Flavobacteriales bacterium]|nr:T9SS type A sorting domain-containing protein [Flavobacteriales bacterium]HIA12375.1 T9SS type A sorting domain-containing protein [Flavobacteriales bacterium]
MTYQRCCRNSALLNIDTPQVAGFGFDIRIPDSSEAYCNSSPYFNNYPPTIICLNEPFAYDHSATDSDGDSLVYYLCTPNDFDYNTWGIIPDPPGPPSINYDMAYLLPYDSAYPVWAPIDSFVIDPVTGWMTGTLEIPGNYVVAVCVSEYRNGVLLSTNKRDFPFHVAQCLSDPLTGFTSQPDLCNNLKVNFTYTGKAVQSFFWDFGISSSNSDTSVFQNPSFTFPDTGTYAVKLVVNQNYSCADTLTINVTPPNPLMADFSLVSCSGDTVVFQDESVTNAYAGSITSWTWVYGDVSNNDFIQNPSHAYASPGTYVVTLIVTTANGCIDTLITSITTSPCEIIGQQELDTRDNDILVYPNPNNGLFTLDLSRFDLVGNMQLSVFSIDGQRIQSRSINGGSTPINIEVDLENNKKGIYFLKLVTDGEVVTKKIVLQ